MPNGTKAFVDDLTVVKIVSVVAVLAMIAGAVNALHQMGMRLW